MTSNGIEGAFAARWDSLPEETRRRFVFRDQRGNDIRGDQTFTTIMRDGAQYRLPRVPTETITREIKAELLRNPALRSIMNSYVEELQRTILNSENDPVRVPEFWSPTGDKNVSAWFFKKEIYAIEIPKRHTRYTGDQIKLLILEFYDRERRKFERLQKLYRSDSNSEPSNHRERIPEQVRIEVWRRDDGKCARCGSREKLEYDHIVPVSKGGSNTARNIELLCETCNRKKSDHIE